ncbi:MAG: wax ester/triacylglycerol synthase family O-acyltransferase [Ilumatobacteraceae bacterium]
MKQLTGLDASFLYMETPTTFGHVNGLSIYQRPSDDFDAFDLVYRRFEGMIGRLEPMRRRLVQVPLSLDHPYWIDDPDFDLDYHVRHIGLAPPGAADQLAEQVARIVARPMDRSHPLWECYVIEGLADGRWAMLTKTHHSTIDGASGVILLNMLTDTDPDASNTLEPVAWSGEPIPSDNELLRLTAANLASNPLKSLRLQLRLVRDIASAAGLTSVSGLASQARSAITSIATGGGSDDSSPRISLPITPAPPTPWSKSITSHRRFAMRSTSLDNIKALKDATGCTVNDIVMAICAGALREYLIKHDALPDKPLRAMVPVSIRTGDEEDPWTNRVSSIIAELPTNCDDPLERVARCHAAMDAAKRQMDLVPATALTDITQFTSPVVATSAMRLISRLKLADRVNMPANVTISNVPGPRQPLYFAGAQLDNYIPVSTIADGMGLNITVHSYMNKLDFGLIACRELVPDLWDMVDMHIAEIARLFEATGAEWVEPQQGPSMRRGGNSVTAIPRRVATAPPAAEKPATKKPAVKKATPKKAAPRKTAAKKTAAKKTAAPKKTAAKKAPARKRTAARLVAATA